MFGQLLVSLSPLNIDSICVCVLNLARYDMDFGGSFWAYNSLTRDLMNAEKKAVLYPKLDMGEDPAVQEQT